MKKIALALASLAFALLATGCDKQGSSAEAPPDFRVVAGDASVTVSWTAEPGVEYWIFFGPGNNITTANWATSGGTAIPQAISPRIITGLANGREYSFTINARKDKGPGGPGAPTQVVTPTLAGANWALGTPLGTTRLNSIAGGSVATGFAVATVGAGGTIFTNVTNGPMAARTNPAAPTDLNAVWYGLAGFVAAGANGTVLHSADSITWTTQTSGSTATLYGGAASITGQYVGVGSGGTILLSSNGTTWTTPNSGVTTDLYAAGYGAGRFLAVGAGGTIITSTDGNGWATVTSGTTNDLRGVTYGVLVAADGTTANLYIAVGAAGTVLTSPDGVAWTVRPPLTPRNLLGVTYGGRFVTVGAGGVIFTSLDGVTWEARSSGTPNDLTSVVRQLLGYTAVGDAGANASTF